MDGDMPTKCQNLIAALAISGWSFVVQHGKDTGDSPFISIEGRRDTCHVMITWHTRATGTYRLFSCMVNKCDVSLTKAMEAVTA
jgi:hypothetical protein